MKRGAMIVLAGMLLVLGIGASSAPAASRYPVSIGFSYGTWTPSLDAYNLRFVDQMNPTILADGSPLYVREPLDNLDSTATFNWFTTGPVQYLFSSSWGFGINAKLRLHSDMFALFEYDWWKQSVGSRRNFGGQYGYEGYTVKLNPVTVSLVYYMPVEIGAWWPQMYLGAGAGAVLVERTNLQITNATPRDGGTSTSSGSGTILTGLGGLEYIVPVPMLQDRVSLFFEGRYVMGDYGEEFTDIGSAGSAVLDSTGREQKTDAAVSVQGPQFKFGMAVNFGQLRPRPEKGILSGLLEPSRRGVGGYAMAPSYGAPPAAGAYGGGVTLVYPQPQEQVQVVTGTGHVDEDRIRQIIREELLNARVTAAPTGPVDDLAEQQLRSIRERRLQAEQELQQLKELLREEG